MEPVAPLSQEGKQPTASRQTALLVALVWLLSSLGLGGVLLFRPDGAPLISLVAYGLFAAVLTIHLALTPRSSTTLPCSEFFSSTLSTFPVRLTTIVFGFGLLIILSLVLRQGATLVVGSALVALWLIVRHRQQLRARQQPGPPRRSPAAYLRAFLPR